MLTTKQTTQHKQQNQSRNSTQQAGVKSKLGSQHCEDCNFSSESQKINNQTKNLENSAKCKETLDQLFVPVYHGIEQQLELNSPYVDTSQKLSEQQLAAIRANIRNIRSKRNNVQYIYTDVDTGIKPPDSSMKQYVPVKQLESINYAFKPRAASAQAYKPLFIDIPRRSRFQLPVEDLKRKILAQKESITREQSVVQVECKQQSPLLKEFWSHRTVVAPSFSSMVPGSVRKKSSALFYRNSSLFITEVGNERTSNDNLLLSVPRMFDYGALLDDMDGPVPDLI